MSEIDPVEFGELRAAVASMKESQQQLRELVLQTHRETKESMDALKTDFGSLMTIVNKAEGGWRMLIGLTGVAATLGSGITWVLHKLFGG